MQTKRVVWLLVFAAVTLMVEAAVGALRRGFSARDQPSLVESYVVRTARKLAVPSKAMREKNPVLRWPQHRSAAPAEIGFARDRGLGKRASQPGMGGFSRQSLSTGVQGAACAFQVGI
jgi:hypothetical protein